MHFGVVVVIMVKDFELLKFVWMLMLFYDVQVVFVSDKVCF